MCLWLDIKEEHLNDNTSLSFPDRDKEMAVPYTEGMGRREKRWLFPHTEGEWVDQRRNSTQI